jgi:hypothetical protein
VPHVIDPTGSSCLSPGRPPLALSAGFGSSPDFWQQLLWTLLLDVPLGLREIRCPVTLVRA